MQHRILTVGSLLLASVVAAGPVVAAQTPQQDAHTRGGCFTPVAAGGPRLLVIADGATEKILRAEPRAQRRHVTHSLPHTQPTLGATPSINASLWPATATVTADTKPSAPHASPFRHTVPAAKAAVTHSLVGSPGCRLTLR